MKYPRREILKKTGMLTSAALVLPLAFGCKPKEVNPTEGEISKNSNETGEMFFKISLAQWSLHRTLNAGELDNLEFAAKTKSLGIDAVEYVNQFFKDKAEDHAYLSQMNQAAADAGVIQLLIMVDGEGGLGNPNDAERQTAVENHYKWVNAAKSLGCHSIRVNAFGQGSAEDVSSASVDGLGSLSAFAAKENINVIVENHGGYSSNAQWLTNVIKQVNMPNCGTLPDFGNFCIRRDKDDPYGKPCAEEYDRYKGVTEMMPYAKAVSAKSNDFNADGDEIHTDFLKMMQIVKDHNYKGYVGIEYEGGKMSEIDGIKATRDLLLKVGEQLS